MAWFITSVDPGLTVQVEAGKAVRFVAGEYRTLDPEEIAALRADGRCDEAFEKGEAGETPSVREGYAVNLETETMHHLAQAGTRCHIPDDVENEPGWKVYKRMSDAMRWQKGVELCGFCMR